MVEGDAKAVADLSVIVFQTEAHLEDLPGGNELSGGFFACAAMKLEDEGFVGEGELHDVRAVAFLSDAKGRLGLGVESGNPCGEDFINCGLALGRGRGHVDLVGGKSKEGGKEGRF